MTEPDSTQLTARTPEDLLASVPLVLGFHPDHSLVMLTFGTRDSFHARVDLPTCQREVPAVVRLLLDPVRRHGVRAVVFVVFGPDSPTTRCLGHRLVSTFPARGVGVIDVLRAEGGHWFPIAGRRWGPGTAYDLADHPFRAEAVLRGIVALPSRDALAATIARDPVLVAAVTERLDRRLGRGTEPDQVAERAWVESTVVAAAAGRRSVTPGVAARLLLAVREIDVRDVAWLTMSRSAARDHAQLWTTVVRGAPDGLVAAPAALLAFAAWLAGDGALAWCAVERCLADDPGYTMAGLVAQLLNAAVPPSSWQESDGWHRPVHDPA